MKAADRQHHPEYAGLRQLGELFDRRGLEVIQAAGLKLDRQLDRPQTMKLIGM